MLRSFSIRIFVLVLTILAVATVGFLAVWQLSQNLAMASLTAVFIGSHLGLFCLLTKVWLIDKFPAYKAFLEKIPGVDFGVPVPDTIRKQVVVPRNDNVKRSVVAEEEPTWMADNTVKTEPFTLGTLAFEPPEPLGKSAAAQTKPEVKRPANDEKQFIQGANIGSVPTLDKVVKSQTPPSVENAFRKSKSVERQHRKNELLDRFHFICRILKQTNQEVAVWTEGELATLANTMLTPQSEDKDMIAILLPQRVVRVNCQRTFEFEHHAQVLHNILLATGESLGVTFVNSSKDEITGQCVVNFEYQGKPVTWRFSEKGNRLSDKFLKSTLLWVAKRAQGKFLALDSGDYQKSFVFIPQQITNALVEERISA